MRWFEQAVFSYGTIIFVHKVDLTLSLMNPLMKSKSVTRCKLLISSNSTWSCCLAHIYFQSDFVVLEFWVAKNQQDSSKTIIKIQVSLKFQCRFKQWRSFHQERVCSMIWGGRQLGSHPDVQNPSTFKYLFLLTWGPFQIPWQSKLWCD